MKYFLFIFLNIWNFLNASNLNKVSRSEFIPYGENYTDSLFPREDDHSVSLSIDVNFKFFDKTYSRLWINSNGIISFDGMVLNYTAQQFPLNNFISVAPFWADVDIRKNGFIYYRQIKDEFSLKKISDEINLTLPNINFKCK